MDDVQTILRPLLTKYTGRQVPRGRFTPRDLERAHRARCAQLGVRPKVVEAPLVMRVNHDRWIADCACRSGLTTGEGWTEARCFACGAVYVNVVWPAPEDRKQIAAALARRQAPSTRNWEPDQHWSTLVAENLAHAAELIPERGRR